MPPPLTTRDRIEIIELYARYAHATDGQDAVARADLFLDDGVFDPSGPTLRGRAEILAAPRPPNAGDLRHWAGMHVVEGDGETVRVTSYLAVLDTGASTGQRPHISVTGTYYDTMKKVDGRWRFAYRNFVRDDLRDDMTIGHRL
jgi:ketosteroid isomerase-like protein